MPAAVGRFLRGMLQRRGSASWPQDGPKSVSGTASGRARHQERGVTGTAFGRARHQMTGYPVRVEPLLDSIDDATFRALNDVDFPVQKVLDGIDAAAAAGLRVKVNAVVKRGANDGGIVSLAEHFRGTGHTLRFIEYMDVGHTNGWRLDDVVSSDEIVAMIDAVYPLEPVAPARPDETARRWRYRDGAGEVG